MATDEAFEGVGQKPGIEIFRIEKMKVVPQDPSSYGTFYSGDSYILLSTKKEHNSSKLEWDVHFWLGDESSKDEQGVAAYKTVELDDSLGGAPVQYREIQEHESKKFLSYFKDGIKYLDGGVDTGFRAVQRGVYEKRLFQVKGKRNIRVKQVELHCKSLNRGDAFILDDGLKIYIWVGPECRRTERMKAVEVARKIKDEERGGKAKLLFVDDRWDFDPDFFEALGSKETIKDASEAGDDMAFEKSNTSSTKLYRISDASGEIEMEAVDELPLKREHLDPADCFILDCGTTGIFVWVGKKCTQAEKKDAMKMGTSFIEKKGYPEWTQVTRVVEGGEPPIFRQFFTNWRDPEGQQGNYAQQRARDAEAVTSKNVDVRLMHQKSVTKEDKLMPDDGSGDVKVFRVEKNDLIPQPKNTTGIFYTGDCYVIQYSYHSGGERTIIYFWQGSKCSTDERAGSAILAQHMDDQMGGIATQIRVTQGGENEHFLRIFHGKMIILLGGLNNEAPDSPIRVFHVRGTNTFNTRAMQVLPRAGSLNSNDAFIIESDSKVYIWYGKGASPDERSLAMKNLHYLCRDKGEFEIVEVEEEEEGQEFWDLLGGKEPYATGERLKTNNADMPARLFHCSNASGRFEVEEIVDFFQEDLVEEDVMILDTIDEVYVWIGKESNVEERKASLQTALNYIETDPTGRNPDNTVILQVKQGLEPPGFTGHFLGWDPDKWSHGKTYEDLKRELGQECVKATTVEQELAVYSTNNKHPYSELVKRVPPKGVDPSCKEKYLTDEEFEEVFQMKRSEYDCLKQWKQINLKKKHKLF